MISAALESCNQRMDEIKPFASQKIKPYGTGVSDAVETTWTIRAAVSAFVVIALASFCSPSLQTLNSSTTGAQHHREQFTHKGKINFCRPRQDSDEGLYSKGQRATTSSAFLFCRGRFVAPHQLPCVLALPAQNSFRHCSRKPHASRTRSAGLNLLPDCRRC
jgi:hypothetical protein